MGLNDAAEALAVCHEVNVANEKRIAEVEQQLETAKEQLRERARAFEARGQRIAELETAFDLEKSLSRELEHENVRLESALADRMRTDSRGPAAAEADRDDARQRLARIGALVDPRRDDWNALSPIIVRRILDETTAEPFGVYLQPEDALTAGRAVRALAGVIRATSWNTDGDQAHADADRLDRLADLIGAPPA